MSYDLNDIIIIMADAITGFLTLLDVNHLGLVSKQYQKTLQSVLIPLYFWKKLGLHVREFSSCSMTALQVHHICDPREECLLYYRFGRWEFYCLQDSQMIYRHVKTSSRNLFWRWWNNLWDPSQLVWRNQLVDVCLKTFIPNMMYYEVHITNLADANQDVITMGFSSIVDFSTCVKHEWHVGYTKDSVGFHTDDGHIYLDMSDFYLIGNANNIRAGEVIGCGYLLDSHQIFITRNGKLLYPYISIKSSQLMYPCIISSGETIQYTIQWKPPFLYDIHRFRNILDKYS